MLGVMSIQGVPSMNKPCQLLSSRRKSNLTKLAVIQHPMLIKKQAGLCNHEGISDVSCKHELQLKIVYNYLNRTWNEIFRNLGNTTQT